MKKTIVMLMVLLVAISMVNAKRPVSCSIQSTTDIVYYSGSGASSLSQSWLVHYLDWLSQYNDIQYVDLSATEVGNCDLSGIDLYIQPGGNAYLAQKWIGADGKANINNYLNNGGAYFGACAGWYYATGDYYWQDSYYDHINLLGAYPSTVEGSIYGIADYDDNPGYAVTQLDNGLNALYWGGPTTGHTYTIPGVGVVEASYVYQGLPAVVQYNNMLLTSVHLEAYENDGFSGLTTEEREANYIYLTQQINNVAGTNYQTPTPPEPPVCGDLVCEGDETYENCPSDCDAPPPGPIFEDDFSNGMVQWTVTGIGNTWYILDNQAYVKKTGVDKHTFMTADVTSGGTLTYDRKLVGLDAADDFGVEYFDGTWNYLEHLGSGRENGDYVTKTFLIPSDTTKIRFMCECGAVSEKCYVDNVRIDE